MNTNEFYKQLMSEYTFDHEKIKKTAMGKVEPKKAKRSPIKWASFAAAAAAVTVTVGTVAVLNSGSPVSVTPTSMTPTERFRLSVEAYEKADENTEEVFLYVTFKACETPSDMQSILAKTDSTGKIKVITVYCNDGTEITGSSNIEQLFEDEQDNITAVKIRCPGNFFKHLSNTPEVYLVESGDAFENKIFSVIDTENSYDDYPDYGDYTSASETDKPEQTDPPVIGDTTPVSEKA